jgi:ABC-2 type transport system ATP-binding protein
LTCVSRIYKSYLPTSFFRFVGEELVKLVGQQTRIDLTLNANTENVMSAWQGVEGVSRVSAEDGLVTVLAQDSNLVLPRLFETSTRLSARITSVGIREPNLEAVFLHLTGRALRD